MKHCSFYTIKKDKPRPILLDECSKLQEISRSTQMTYVNTAGINS